jgi:hypothetical protein
MLLSVSQNATHYFIGRREIAGVRVDQLCEWRATLKGPTQVGEQREAAAVHCTYTCTVSLCSFLFVHSILSFPGRCYRPHVVLLSNCVGTGGQFCCGSGHARSRQVGLGPRAAKLLGGMFGQQWMRLQELSVRFSLFCPTRTDAISGICESSQDGDYLTKSVECAVQSCSADGVNVVLNFLAPLQMYCKATRDDIPDEVMSSAYACATATATSATPSFTRNVEHSTQASKTSKGLGNGLESTIISTVTVTTTDESGNTLQLLIPIVMGPSTMTTGEMMTSTLGSKPTASPAATSNAEAAASTSTASSRAQATNIGNGSPFDLSAQGGSARWSFSVAFVGSGMLFGALAGL